MKTLGGKKHVYFFQMSFLTLEIFEWRSHCYLVTFAKNAKIIGPVRRNIVVEKLGSYIAFPQFSSWPRCVHEHSVLEFVQKI